MFGRSDVIVAVPFNSMIKMFAILSNIFLLAVAAASPLNHIRSSSIEWGPCSINGTLPIDCANFTVPLDYTDKNCNSTLDLELLRVPAINGPSRGSIFFNFGGPGVEVRASLAGRAHTLQAITGGHHDLIGIDPRGTANTLTFQCYANETEQAMAVPATGTGLTNSSDIAAGASWITMKVMGRKCAKTAGENGTLIGTAFTARDMMQVVDALGEGGLLRYWGFSYGTLLGATVVSMFPDRMDKVILDGVMNPHEYYSGPEPEAWSDADMAFSAFLQACLDAPSECALAKNNTSAAELEASIWKLVYDLKYLPVEIDGTIVEYTTIKSMIRTSLYTVEKFPPFARALNGLLVQNYTQYLEGAAEIAAMTPPIMAGDSTDNSAYGIHCSDKRYRKSSFTEMLPDIEMLEHASQIMGDIAPVLMQICAQWKMMPKERYEGDFQNIKTQNPVFLIGNTFDSATSIKGAFNVSSGFVDSVVLRQDGFGHGSLSHPSLCTSRAVRAYFEDGVLPEQGAVCGVDVAPFSNTTFEDLLPELGF
ncbi:TAP-like protein-domain-containing protein, partial [Rhexocercosporidium sp. MPI-PUGE-AT-0058]